MTITRTKALASIKQATPDLCKNIPTENSGWFVTQIRHAVEDYFEHPRPRELAAEIRAFSRVLRGPQADVLAAFDSLSPVSLEIMSRHGNLPDRHKLANPATWSQAIKELRGRMVAAAYVARAEDNKPKNPRKRTLKGTELPSQNRKKEKLLGQNQLKYALKHGLTHFPEYFLVKQLAAAYAGATRKRTTRNSDGYGPSPFGAIVQLVWDALDIKRPKNVEHIVRQHVEERRAYFSGVKVPHAP